MRRKNCMIDVFEFQVRDIVPGLCQHSIGSVKFFDKFGALFLIVPRRSKIHPKECQDISQILMEQEFFHGV